MAKKYLDRVWVRKLFVGFAVIILILAILAILLLQVEHGRILIQKRYGDFPPIKVDKGIPMADSDYITIDGTKYPHPDKLYDIEEIWIYGTNETNPDTDGDGMEDGWEALYGEIDLATGFLTIDPNKFDAFDNPDKDGWDEDHNGELECDEHLTNLEEYCGGSFNWGPFKGHNLDPQGYYDNYLKSSNNGDKVKSQNEYEIYRNQTLFLQYHGGFHLIDYPYNEYILEDFNEYPTVETEKYRAFNLRSESPLTTNPCNSDSDFDGMDDGFEVFFREKCEQIQELYYPNFDYTFDPLNSSDAKLNFDLKKTEHCLKGEIDFEYEFKPDCLTNFQEYENRTDPDHVGF